MSSAEERLRKSLTKEQMNQLEKMADAMIEVLGFTAKRTQQMLIDDGHSAEIIRAAHPGMSALVEAYDCQKKKGGVEKK